MTVNKCKVGQPRNWSVEYGMPDGLGPYVAFVVAKDMMTAISKVCHSLGLNNGNLISVTPDVELDQDTTAATLKASMYEADAESGRRIRELIEMGKGHLKEQDIVSILQDDPKPKPKLSYRDWYRAEHNGQDPVIDTNDTSRCPLDILVHFADSVTAWVEQRDLVCKEPLPTFDKWRRETFPTVNWDIMPPTARDVPALLSALIPYVEFLHGIEGE